MVDWIDGVWGRGRGWLSGTDCCRPIQCFSSSILFICSYLAIRKYSLRLWQLIITYDNSNELLGLYFACLHRVLTIDSLVFFLLSDSPASEFYMCRCFGKPCLSHIHRWCKQEDLTPPMKMEQTGCSETSAYKFQTPVNHPKERIGHSEQRESWKSRIDSPVSTRKTKGWRIPRRTTQHHNPVNCTRVAPSVRPQSSRAERLSVVSDKLPFPELGWPSTAAGRWSCIVQGQLLVARQRWASQTSYEEVS